MAFILCRKVKMWAMLVKETVLIEFPWVTGIQVVFWKGMIFHQTLNRNISNRPMSRKYACWHCKGIPGLIVQLRSLNPSSKTELRLFVC